MRSFVENKTLLFEMSKCPLPKAVHSVISPAALPTTVGEQDEQPEAKKALLVAASDRSIQLCAKCKSILALVPTSLAKEALNNGAIAQASSSDECSCYCHVIHARVKAQLNTL